MSLIGLQFFDVSAFTLNDGATDSTGHYSLEATYFPALMGDGSVEFKVQFVHDCSDIRVSKEANQTKRKLRVRHRSKSNRTIDKRSSIEVQVCKGRGTWVCECLFNNMNGN